MTLKKQVEEVLQENWITINPVFVWHAVLVEFYKQYLFCNTKSKKYSLRLEYADRVPGLDSIKNALKSIRRNDEK